MGECVGFEDNWGLQAIVQPPLISSDDDLLFDVSHVDALTLDDFFGATMVSNDALLDELCQPFYKPSSISFTGEMKQEGEVKKGGLDEKSPVLETPIYVPKFKRRKNEQKRVVVQVPAEELSEDKWAWRKYGQKPIKGSSYPRSYYRCSSSKGCLARKQVEQSNNAPGMFIVTYTAEHSHSQPTRRNSLAGTIRNKFPSPSTPAVSKTVVPKMVKPDDDQQYTSTVTTVHHVPELLRETEKIKDEVDMQLMMDNNDDFFAGLEDLDGLISQFSYSSQYCPSMFSC